MGRRPVRPAIDKELVGIWQAILSDAANVLRYKDGAFEDLIQRDTPARQAVDTYLDSALLTRRERAIFERIRSLVGDVTDRESEYTHKTLRKEFGRMVSEDMSLRVSNRFSKEREEAVNRLHWSFVDGKLDVVASQP
ncbi:hypothetical protein PV08_07518 [Exophiala spinifera]|uniref:Uncharacterized protein n=1 Tax=Exophiala spinifera TaxID=91928 RepID=A0A0D2BTY5_9EURO|nr:uncharacterized protein PV08_07518 [Exophiala spinifera]KIW14734.1 hypothetical protein PV08_07518 [Exophiala spinifera]